MVRWCKEKLDRNIGVGERRHRAICTKRRDKRKKGYTRVPEMRGKQGNE